METQLIDTWHINNRINLYLLDAIAPIALNSVPTGMKGRSVGAIFAHLHNNRLAWLETNLALMQGQQKIPVKTKADKDAITADLLRAALESSGEGIATMLEQGIAKGRISGCQPHPVGCLGYFIAHEAYHRGEICLTLTEAGHALPDEILYGLWDWGKR